jgi:TRAP-type mannitol/chloroaromatic compound transport system permease large subunit
MDVISGTAPFVLLMLAFIGWLMVWPEMALWLPQQLFAQ